MIKHIPILINVPSKKMFWVCQQDSVSKTHTTAVMFKNDQGLYKVKASVFFMGQ